MLGANHTMRERSAEGIPGMGLGMDFRAPGQISTIAIGGHIVRALRRSRARREVLRFLSSRPTPSYIALIARETRLDEPAVTGAIRGSSRYGPDGALLGLGLIQEVPASADTRRSLGSRVRMYEITAQGRETWRRFSAESLMLHERQSGRDNEA